NSGMFMVRGDSPYRTIADLRGKPIAWGASGSGFVVLARYVFDGLGLDIDKDFSPIYLASAGDGPKMVLDGRAAAQWAGGVGWPGFAAISNRPAGARFITPDAESMKRVLAKYPFINPVTLPAARYPVQTAPVAAPGSWALLLARPEPPDGARSIVAEHLGDALKQPVLVEHRPGAGGIICTQAMLNAGADGYTLMVQSAAHAAHPAIYKSLP